MTRPGPMMIRIERLWYDRHPLVWLLLPLSWLFWIVSGLRRLAYRLGLLRRHYPGVPVIVVGNITVGGTGKTPLVVELARRLREAGRRPGIVTRGYRGRARHWPQQVRPDSDPGIVGDEAVLLARRTACPVTAGPDRVAAARALLAATECDLLISDDGLQHYRLGRDIEIAVIDGVRRLGNGHLLPAGPLREPARRLSGVDFIVVNGGLPGRHEFAMRLRPTGFRAVAGPDRRLPATALAGQRVHAVAAIGHPGRFFATLRSLGIDPIEHPLPDHAEIPAETLRFADGLPVVMTEKDAVKCRRLAPAGAWYLEVEAEVDERLWYRLLQRLPAPASGRDRAPEDPSLDMNEG